MAHFFHLETLEFNHFHVQDAGMEGRGLFPYGRKSAGQVAVDTLWESSAEHGYLDGEELKSLRGDLRDTQDLGIS